LALWQNEDIKMILFHSRPTHEVKKKSDKEASGEKMIA
jgi:hypothetical protein